MSKIKRIEFKGVFTVSYNPVLGKFWIEVKDRRGKSVAIDGMAEIMAFRFAIDRAVEAFNREITDEVRYPLNVDTVGDNMVITHAAQDFIEATAAKQRAENEGS